MRLSLNAKLTRQTNEAATKGGSDPVMKATFKAPMSSAEVGDLAGFLKQEISLTIGELNTQVTLKKLELEPGDEANDAAVVIRVKGSASPEIIGRMAGFLGQTCLVRFASIQGSFGDLVQDEIEAAAVGALEG